MRATHVVPFGVLLLACHASTVPPTAPQAPAVTSAAEHPQRAPRPAERCVGGLPLTVHFFDAGQALSALVDLPDGRHILVDAGESPTRAGCGAACKAWHQHVMSELDAALAGAQLDMLWITHQHSDHLGGAPDVIAKYHPRVFVDNGRDRDKPTVSKVHAAASAAGSAVALVDPQHRRSPIPDSSEVSLRPIVPAAWPSTCDGDANACSIGLRLDYCSSSLLFTGDAPSEEEASLEVGPVTLMQVGHHGSNTSSSESFLDKLQPRYAVISAGKIGDGTNMGYCHPRAVTVANLTKRLGGPGAKSVKAFDGDGPCKGTTDDHWKDVATSDRLWITARDGEVTLTTTGDGTFR